MSALGGFKKYGANVLRPSLRRARVHESQRGTQTATGRFISVARVGFLEDLYPAGYRFLLLAVHRPDDIMARRKMFIILLLFDAGLFYIGVHHPQRSELSRNDRYLCIIWCHSIHIFPGEDVSRLLWMLILADSSLVDS